MLVIAGFLYKTSRFCFKYVLGIFRYFTAFYRLYDVFSSASTYLPQKGLFLKRGLYGVITEITKKQRD